MSVIIGLHGGAGVGKDIFAKFTGEWLATQPHLTFYQTSFAEPVYELAAVIFGVTPEFLGERRKKQLANWFTVTQEQLERARDLWNSWSLDEIIDFSDVWPKFEKLMLEDRKAIHFTQEEVESPLYNIYVSPRQILQWVGTELGRKMVRTSVWIDLLKTRIKRNSASLTIVTDIRFDDEALVIHEYPGMSNSLVIQIDSPASPHLIKSNHVSENGVSKHFIDKYFVNKFEGLEAMFQDVNEFLNKEIFFHV